LFQYSLRLVSPGHQCKCAW